MYLITGTSMDLDGLYHGLRSEPELVDDIQRQQMGRNLFTRISSKLSSLPRVDGRATGPLDSR